MQYESEYGKQLFECKESLGQTLGKRLRFILPSLVFIGAGILAMLNPDFAGSEEDLKMLLPLFFGAGALFALLGLFFVKPLEAAIYESGFVNTRGSKVIELDFSSIKGISDSTTVIKIYGIIPATKTRVLTLTKKDGNRIELTKTFVPDFNQFIDAFSTAFTKHLLKDVETAGIDKANISFGDSLELTGGQMVYDEKKKGKTAIPLSRIHSIESDGEGYWLALKGANQEELANVRIDKALNIEALYRIVDMAQKARKETI